MTRSNRQSSLRNRRIGRHGKARIVLCSAASLIAAHLFSGSRAQAGSGTWNTTISGVWSNASNWSLNSIADGIDSTADFSKIDVNGDVTITLDSNRTIGNVTMGDSAVAFTGGNEFINGSILNLAVSSGTPTLNAGTMFIAANFSDINSTLTGNQGFLKTGIGTLAIGGTNTFTGLATVQQGTLRLLSAGALGTTNSLVMNGGNLELRNDNSTNFGSAISGLANFSINVDNNGTLGSGTQNQTHTVGAISLTGARTVTITSGDGFSLATGAVTGTDSEILTNSGLTNTTLASYAATSANASTLTLNGSGSFTVSGTVSQGMGALAVLNSSTHTVTFNGALTHTGGTSVTGGGEIFLGTGIALPTGGAVTISNGTLDANGNSSIIGALTMGGGNSTLLTESGTVTLGGDVTYVAGAGTANIVGNVNLGSVTRTFNIAKGSSGTIDMVINGALGGSGAGFIKAGAGTLRLTGANTSIGQVTLNAGTLQADASNGTTLGTGSMSIVGGTLRIANVGTGSGASTGTLTLGGADSSGTLIVDGAGNGATSINFAGFGGRNAGATGLLTVIPNSGTINTTEAITLTTAPTGSLFMNGILPAYVATQNSGGDTNLDFLSVDGTNHLVPASYASSITAGANAVVDVEGGADIGSSTTHVFALKVNGNSVNGSGGTLLIGDGTDPAGLILNNGASINASNLSFGSSEGIVWAGGGGATINSALNLQNTLTTGGAQQLTLAGPVTLTGSQNISVNGGTVIVSNTLSGGALTKRGPGLLVLTGNESTYANTLTAGTGTLQIGDGNADGTLSATSPLITNADLVFNRNDSVTYPNAISGTGDVVQAGTATVSFSGALSYGGNLIVNSGSARTTGTTVLPSASGLVVNAGSFDLNGINQTIANLSNNSTTGGTVTSAVAGNVSLSVGAGSFNGSITNGAGVVQLIKTGAGTLTLDPSTANSTYTGGTRVTGGILYLGDGSLGNGRALGTGSITLAGGTLALATAFNSGGGSTNLTNAMNVPAGQTGGLYLPQVGSSTGAITSGDSTSVLNVAVPPSAQYAFGATTGRMADNVTAFTGEINAFAPNGPGALRLASEASSATLNAIVRLNLNDNVTAFASQNPPNGGSTASVKNVNIGELTGTSLSFFAGSSVPGRFVQLHVGSLNTNSTFNGVLTDSLNAQGFSGPGQLRVDKIGTGTWTLTNNSPYSGATSITSGAIVLANGANLSGTPTISINTGTLAIQGNGTISAASNLAVAAPGTLDVSGASNFSTPSSVTLTGTGNVFGNYTHNAGTLNAGAVGTSGKLTFDNALTIQGGATIGADITPSSGNGILGGVNDETDVLGNFTLAGTPSSAPTVRLNFLGGAPTVANVGQQYPIFHYNAAQTISLTGLNNIRVLASVRGTFSLVQDTALNTVDVLVNSISSGVANLTWTGNNNPIWDINTTQNWNNGTSAATYFDGDNVAFTTNGNNKSITLVTPVSPGSVLIDSTGDYTFGGAAGIVGTAALTKNNINTVTMNLSNGYTGGTILNAGTLVLNNVNGAGTGSIQMGNGATLVAGASGIPNQLNVAANNAGTLFYASDNNASFNGNVTGAGTLLLAATHLTGTTNANIINLAGSIDAFTGTIDLSNINAAADALRLVGPTATNAPGAVFNLGNGSAILQNRNGGTLTIGGLAGGFTTTLSGSQAGLAPITWIVGGANSNEEFDGAIVNQSAANVTNIIKNGTGTWTLGGQNTYTGTTTVNAGTLFINNAAFSASSFTVNTGGTLAFNGVSFNSPTTTIRLNAGGAMNVSAAGNFNPGGSVTLVGTGGTVYGEYNHNQGTISPGTGVLTIGTVNFDAGTLHLSGGALQYDLNTATTTGAGVNDLITVGPAGTLDLESGQVFANFLTAPANGSNYTLITYAAGQEAGNVSNLTLNTRATANLVDTGSSIQLHVTAFNAATLTWNGTGDSNWDVANHANWKDFTTGTDKFFQLDNVVFDDTNSVQQNISINTQVVPTSLVVTTNTNAFSFQGTGTISGATSLVKNGSSTLTISTNNNYTGGTAINGGTLAITSVQPFLGTATFAGGTALAAIEQGDQSLSFGAGAIYAMPAGGAATIALMENNSGSQTTGVEVGIAMNGTLSGGTTTSGATANIVLTNANNSATAPVLTDINTNNTAFVGTINILNNGTTTLRLGTAAGAANAFWNLGNSGTLATNTGTVTTTIAMGGLSGGPGAVLQGFVGFNAGTITNAAGGPAVYQIGSLNVDSSFAGTIVNGTGTLAPQTTSITKFGTAKLTLTGTNTYTGATTINGGTVVIGATGSIASSGTIALAGGVLDTTANASGYTASSTTLTGSGTFYGAVTHSTGNLTPGTSGTVGTLTFNNGLNITTDTLNADLSTAGVVGGNNDLVDVNGALSLTGSSAVNVNFLQLPTVGSYPIIRSTSRTGTGTITIGALGFRGTANLDFSSPTQVNLTITAFTPASLSWRGAGNNGAGWDVNTSQNWLNGAANSTFFQFDSVAFTDVASAPTAVTINTNVFPGSVLVNSSTNNYTFQGTGQITGPGSLTKSGTSTLTIAMANTYLGGTTLNNGTISVGSLGSSALGSGSINLNGGAITATGTSTVNFGTAINAAGTSSSTLSLNGTGFVTTLNGNLTGTGSINLLSDNATKLIDFGGSNSNFGGQIVLLGTQTIRMGSNAGSSTSTWSLPGGGTLSANAGTSSSVSSIPLGGLNGAATSTLRGYNAGGTGGAVEYQLGGASANATFAGNIIDGMSTATGTQPVLPVTITKVGNNQQTLSGSNSYTGGTNVDAGTLAFVGANAWGPALTGTAPTVLNGGRLVFDYSTNTAANPAMTISSILSAGAPGNFLTGQLRTTNAADGKHGIGWIDNGTTTVTVGYTYLGDANVDGKVDTSDFMALSLHFGSTSAVWGQGDFNYDGKVNALDFNAISTNFGATAIPAPPALGVPLLGTLVPEPGSIAMLAMAAGGLLARRRRK